MMIGILKLSNNKCNIHNKKIYKEFIPFENKPSFIVMTKKKSNKDIYAIADKNKKIILKYIDKLNENLLLTYFWKKHTVINYPINIKIQFNKNKIITIDNDKTRIFDDAIQCIKNNNNYLLNIFITDTSKYMYIINNELNNRIMSVYKNNLFPENIIDICSLKENNSYNVCKISFKISNQIDDISFEKDNIYIDNNLTYYEIDKLQQYPEYIENIFKIYNILTNKNDKIKTIIKYFMELTNKIAALKMKNNGIYCKKMNKYNIYTYTYEKQDYTHFTSPLRRYIDNIVRDIIFKENIQYKIDLEEINRKVKYYNKISSVYKIINHMIDDTLILNVKIIFFNSNSLIAYSNKLKKNIFIDFRDKINIFKNVFKIIIFKNEFKIIVNNIEYVLYLNQNITIQLFLLKKNINFFKISIIYPFKIDLLKNIM